MTPVGPSDVPGAVELLGRGVHTVMPDEVFDAGMGRHAVVAGHPVDAATAALRLGRCDWHVTMVIRESAREPVIPQHLLLALRACRKVTVRDNTELAWAVGLDHLEAVVVRGLARRRVEAFNATLLLVVSRGSRI